jgi:hypothetical protein
MGILKRSSKVIFLVLPLLAALSLSVPFLGMPISEDMGYYATISRYINMGFLPLRDIPVGTNTIAFYINAFIFKVFGATPCVYRIIYIFYACAFALAFYYFCNNIVKSKIYACTSTVIVLILIMQPYYQLGGGRNNLIPVLLFMTLSYNMMLYSKRNDRNFIAGIMLAIAALFNETILFVAILSIGIIIFKNYNNNKDQKWKSIYQYFGGQCLIYLIPVGILTYEKSWYKYLLYMHYIGASSRYNSSFIIRLAGNLKASFYGLENFWLFILIIFAFAFFSTSKDLNIKLLKYYIIPLILADIFVINSTREYHIILALPFIVAISIYYIVSIINDYVDKLNAYKESEKLCVRSKNKKKFKHNKQKRIPPINYIIRRKLYIPLVITLAALLFINGPNIIKNYDPCFKQSMLYWNNIIYNKPSDTNEHTLRMVSLLNNLDYNTISTLSQWPLLFTARKISCSNPFVADLSLPGNSGGLYKIEDFLNSLESKPTDVLVLKTGDSWPALGDPLADLADDKYVCLAQFEKSLDSIYGDRIYYSISAFNKNASQIYREDIKPSQLQIDTSLGAKKYIYTVNILDLLKGINIQNRDRYYIVEVSFLDKDNVIDSSMQSGFNKVYYLKQETNKSMFYIMTRLNNNINLQVYANSLNSDMIISVYEIK